VDTNIIVDADAIKRQALNLWEEFTHSKVYPINGRVDGVVMDEVEPYFLAIKVRNRNYDEYSTVPLKINLFNNAGKLQAITGMPTIVICVWNDGVGFLPLPFNNTVGRTKEESYLVRKSDFMMVDSALFNMYF
jgi:hypothetical protein